MLELLLLTKFFPILGTILAIPQMFLLPFLLQPLVFLLTLQITVTLLLLSKNEHLRTVVQVQFSQEQTNCNSLQK